MTHGIRTTIADWTGYETPECPWRAFYNPFVRRVLDAFSFHESGQLAWWVPQPSHRLVEGVAFYHRTDNSIWSKQMKLEREQRERSASHA